MAPADGGGVVPHDRAGLGQLLDARSIQRRSVRSRQQAVAQMVGDVGLERARSHRASWSHRAT
ncbi:hypothetical protein [Streptomyces sediminimaris]|uniref:hypothetical protein n=1 Tax=Streptomyces sediminimaris TaxID=3383721 RepID=UPI00399C1337